MQKQNRIGKSSGIADVLFGNAKKYSKIMKEESDRLCRRYADSDLAKNFSEMPNRVICLMPMALCDAIVEDLGKKCSKDVLAAVGLCAFPIGTYDDIVDEMPRDRRDVAGLAYSGSIAGLEGMRILFDKNKHAVAQALIDTINQNHFRQQRVVDLLWEGKKITKERYIEGIHHVIDFTSIGLMAGIAEAGRPDLKERMMRFSEGYGLALQIIDDLMEVEEDKATTYKSFAVVEGKPYTKTFEIAFDRIKKARKNLDPEWKKMNKFVDNAEMLLRDMYAKTKA